ncbi:MAG: response regulator [Acidobacteriaceae bacterium]|nr:response regulator [Acidobacteriaceae bacterium]
MSKTGFNYRVLVVDDDESVLELSSLVLANHGYEVRKAKDGFQALLELRRSMPDVIISDLRMPNMSGFELLSVTRRRFPHIPVIAISGEYVAGSPPGLIADAFFVKGQYSPEELFQRIAELIDQSPIRPNSSKPDRAPVWVPCNDQGYFVVTCTDCLRSFSVPEELNEQSEMRETICIFCGTPVRYLADQHAMKKHRKVG